MLQDRTSDKYCNFCGKECLSQREASTLLNSFKKHQQGHKHIPKRAYYCDKCGWYHLTHQVCKMKDSKRGNKYDYKKLSR